MDSATYGKYLAVIMDTIRKSGRRTILLRVHGGLNNLNSSLEATASMTDSILKDPQANAYPLFINWESGLKSSYFEHLFSITQGQRYDTFGRFIVFPVYLVADLGRAITRAPFVWGQQFFNFIKGDQTNSLPANTPSAATVRQEGRLLSANGPNPSAGLSNEIAVSKGAYHRSRAEAMGYVAKGILLTPVKMIGTVIIDAGGTPAWDNMHRRTKTMFHNPNEFRTSRSVGIYTAPSGAVSTLLDSLTALTRTDCTYRITLVGHSMGTIVADEIVRTRDSLPFDNIVFMAAASSVREFEFSVVPYLERHPSTNFYNLTLHPLAELREQTYGGIGPNGSLLEWIDGYLANPETDLDRTMGKYANDVGAAHIFRPPIRRQLHIKAFGYKDGHNCGANQEPYHHGGFNDPSVPFWRPTFWQPGNGLCSDVAATAVP